MSIIVTYVPTEAADAQTKGNYFKQLCSAIDDVTSHDFLAVLTDANARQGLGNVLFWYKIINDSEKHTLASWTRISCWRQTQKKTMRKAIGMEVALKHASPTRLDHNLVKVGKQFNQLQGLQFIQPALTDRRAVTENVALCLRKSKHTTK